MMLLAIHSALDSSNICCQLIEVQTGPSLSLLSMDSTGDIPVEKLVQLYVRTRVGVALKTAAGSESDRSGAEFAWDDARAATEQAFSHVHHRLGEHLLRCVVGPAVDVVFRKVLRDMHRPDIARLLRICTLMRRRNGQAFPVGAGPSVCCFCGEMVPQPEKIFFLPNPYLTWLDETECCEPFSAFLRKTRANPSWATGQTLAMHPGKGDILFAVWRLLHLNYFVDGNLFLSVKNMDQISQALVSSIETCLSDRISSKCTPPPRA